MVEEPNREAEDNTELNAGLPSAPLEGHEPAPLAPFAVGGKPEPALPGGRPNRMPLVCVVILPAPMLSARPEIIPPPAVVSPSSELEL